MVHGTYNHEAPDQRENSYYTDASSAHHEIAHPRYVAQHQLGFRGYVGLDPPREEHERGEGGREEGLEEVTDRQVEEDYQGEGTQVVLVRETTVEREGRLQVETIQRLIWNYKVFYSV